MKYIFILLLAITTVSCNNQKTNEAIADTNEGETTEVAKGSTYGAALSNSEPVSISEMLDKLGGQDSLFITAKGEITSTCKMKGCWMKVALPDSSDLRISFKDYGFFVPKEGMEGKTAVFEGWIKKSILDEETRRHYAKDAGKSEEEINAIVGDEEQLAFVANGVVIKDQAE